MARRRDPDIFKDEYVMPEEQRMQDLMSPEQLAGEAVFWQAMQHMYRSRINDRWKVIQAIQGVSFGVQEPGRV